MKIKKAVLGSTLALCSLGAFASDEADRSHWVAGVSYMNFSDSVGDIDVDFGGLIGSVGYKFETDGRFFVVPEVRLGTGVQSDSFVISNINVDLELDRFVALSVKGQFELESGVYFFAVPSYANAKLTATASLGSISASESDDSWEFGIGAGIGFKTASFSAIEIGYEQYDEVDTLSVGLKFSF